MNIEIERKFLVVSDSYKSQSVECQQIMQAYICSDKNRVVRVRIKNERAFLTLKDASVGFSRHEFEYEIPVADARIMLETMCEPNRIEKCRYVVPMGDLRWEIDEFSGDNAGLVFAEIELPHADMKFEKPDFVGCEVTDDPRFYNANLIKNPYKNWK